MRFLFVFVFFSSFFCFSQSRYISQTTKKIVYSRDRGTCQCCGSYHNLEYDHVMPFSCGGNNNVSNIQLLCLRCNRSKSNSCFCKIHNKKVGVNCCQGKSKTTKSNKTSINARQCSGTTKKGLRCKNRTKSSSGRCYHHQ